MAVEENLGNGKDERGPFMYRLVRKLLVRGRKIARPGVQIDINLERPKSTGTGRLASTDPRAYPSLISITSPIQRIWTCCGATCLSCARSWLNSLWRVLSGARWGEGPLPRPRERSQRPFARPPIRAITRHARRIGNVLDADLPVHGVDGLRVCDASAMPKQINGNLYATVVMMVGKAADLILGQPFLLAEYPLETGL